MIVKKEVMLHHKIFLKQGIPILTYPFDNPAINDKMLDCIKWSRKKETGIVVGSLFTGLGAAFLIHGTSKSVAGTGDDTYGIAGGIIFGSIGVLRLRSTISQGKKAKRSFSELKHLMHL